MAAYRVAVMSERETPLQEVRVEAVSLNSFPTVSATTRTNNAGVATFTGLSGPHWFRALARRTSGGVGERNYLGDVKIQVIAIGEGMNVDYVVDSNGMGTHTTLFGTSGALEAAIATGASRTIWVCTSHAESIAATHNMTPLSVDQKIVVFSGGRNRPIFTVAAGLGAAAVLTLDDSPGSDVDSMLRFEGLAFDRSDVTAGPFVDGSNGCIFPDFEFVDVAFNGTASQWSHIFDLTNSGSADMHNLLFERCVGQTKIDCIVEVNNNTASNGWFVMRDCWWASLGSVQKDSADTHVDIGKFGTFIQDNWFSSITDYLMHKTLCNGSAQYPFVMSNNTILAHTANDVFLEIGTSATTGPTAATITGNYLYCTGGGSSVAVKLGDTAGAGTITNIAITGNALRGPGSGTAIKFERANTGCVVANGYTGWTTNVGGTVGPGVGTPTGDHGTLSGLGDDDHTLYLLADGSRALTANWDVGAFTITAEKFIVDTGFYLDSVAGGSTNYGNASIGASTFSVSAHQQDARKVVLPAGNYTSLAVYGNVNTLTRNIRLCLYDDSSGPNNLIAYTDSISVNTTPGWKSGNIAFDDNGNSISSIDLTTGDYWISVHSWGGGGFTFTWYYDAGAAGDSWDGNGDDWESGPEDPWSGGSSGSRDLSIYITGTATTPSLYWDNGDYDTYDRANDQKDFYISSTLVSRQAAAGLRLAGYGHIGATTAPTNITAGDITGSRLFLPDAALDSEGRLAQILDTYTPSAGAFNTLFARANVDPGVGLGTDEIRAGKFEVNVRPTANHAGKVLGFYSETDHDSGAFNVDTMSGFFSQAIQQVAGTTVTNLYAAEVQYRPIAGATTQAIGLLIQRGSAGDAGTINTGVGLHITASAGATPTTDIAIRSLGGEHRFVGDVKIGADSSPSTELDVIGTVLASTAFTVVDATFSLSIVSSNPRLTMDSGDYLVFDRATNKYSFTVGDTPLIEFTSAAMTLPPSVSIGTDDTSKGLLQLYGHTTGEAKGGSVELYLSADHDGTFQAWIMDAYEDDLRIYSSDAADIWYLRAGGATELPGSLKIAGDLDHDGSNIGFFGTAPVAQAAVYSPTNVVTDRAYDANATTVAELADVLGTLIADLQAYGLLQ